MLNGLLLVLALVILAWSMKYESFHTSDKLRVVTVVTNPNHAYLQWLKQSAAKHNLPVDVLVSEKPIGHGAQGQFGMKIQLFYNHLMTLDDNDYAMFVDGYDVVINSNAQTILERFYRITGGKDVALFSGELYCWPDGDKHKDYDRLKPTTSHFKFLNSGTYMGKVSTLKRIIESRMEAVNATIDDQRFFTDIYLTSNSIVLDHENAIFVAVCGVQDSLVHTPRGWFNPLSNSYPLVFHGNGCGRELWKSNIVPSVLDQPCLSMNLFASDVVMGAASLVILMTLVVKAGQVWRHG